MLDSVVRTLEKNSQISRIRKLVFCACHHRWSKDAQSMSNQELQGCLQALYDRHPTILEFKHALYQIVIKLNHSSEYYGVANAICAEIEKIYDHPPAKPTLTNPVASPSPLVPNAIETQSLHVVHLQIQAHTVPVQVVCEVAIDGQQQIQRVIELPANLAAEYQAWQASYQQVAGQSLIDRATSPDLDRVNRSWESTGNLISMLQRWYQSDQWQALRRQFQSFVPADAPLQIMVSSNDLPRWQLQWTDLSQAVQVQPAHATTPPEPVAVKPTTKPAVSAVGSETVNPNPLPLNLPATSGLGTTGAIGDDLQPPTISSALAVTIPPVVEYDTLTLGQRLTGYHSEVHALAIDPQRGIIVSGHGDIGYRDNNIKVWGADDGQLLRDLAGHSNWVQALVLTQDGLRVYSGGMDGQVLGWDVAAGQPLPFKINAESAVTSLVLAQQEKHVIAGTVDGQIKIWDSHSGNFLTSWFAHEGGVHSLAVTDRLLASAGEDGVARAWDSLNGTGIRQFVGHSGRVTRVVIDPTGTRVVTAGIDRTVRIWEVATGNLLHTLVGHERPINCLILTPDGQSIVSGSDDKTIKIWKLADGRLVNNLYGHETPVLSVAVGGNSLISGGYGEIRIWDIV
jgi:WD40 repeat protein